MKIESLNVGLKIALFGYFRLTFEKKLLSHLKQPRIFQDAKFRPKLKSLKFGTNIALFGCFGCFSYLKSAPCDLSNRKD